MIKDVPGLEGRYAATEDGKIWSHRSKRFLRGSRTPNGYWQVCIGVQDARNITATVHSLVAKTYLGNRPDGYQINHIDGDKDNNGAANLEYVTRLENMAHARAMGLLYNGGITNTKITDVHAINIKHLRNSGVRVAEIAKAYGMSKSGIYRVVNGSRWKVPS